MAARMGQYCQTMGLRPDLVLVSAAKRTRETYDIFAQEMTGQKFNVNVDPSLYNATSTTIKSLVAKAAPDQKIILVIGHNPGIAETAIALSGDGTPAMLAELRAHFPAPALAIIDFQCETWAEIGAGQGKLERFVTKGALGG